MKSLKGSRNLGRTARKRGRQGYEAGIVRGANPGSDRKGPSRGDDGRSAKGPRRRLDHQSAQACPRTGCGYLHRQVQILSGICGH